MKNLLLFGLFFLGTLFPVRAQTRCISAVDVQTKAVVESICVGQQVRFRDCSGTLMKEVYYDFNRQGPHQNFTDTTSFHTFTVPGTYVVSQFARDRQGIDDFFTRTFVVKPLPLGPNQIPIIQSLTGQATPAPGAYTLVLQNLQAGYSYLIETAPAGTTAYSPLDTIRPAAAGTSTYFHSLAASGATPCYRIRATGFCGESPDVLSAPLCGQSASGTAENQRNQISWSPIAQATGYTVQRNDRSWGQFASSATGAVDPDVACGQTYCYRVVALFADGRTSASLPVCLAAISTSAPAAGVLHTTFNGQNQVVVSLTVPENETVQEASILRSVENGSFTQIHKGPQASFIDLSVSDFSRTVCYQAVFQNACGLSSAVSNTSCPILLQASQLPDKAVQLNWTPWRPLSGNQPPPPVLYTVELLDENGTVYARPGSSQGATSFTDGSPSLDFQVLRYRVSATNPAGATLSSSNIVLLERPFEVFVPNAFTPNNDGLNDVFQVKGRFVASFRMTIYNSWGQIIFQTTDPALGWDGQVNGRDAPVGSYAYTVEAIDSTGQKFTKTGTLTLLR